MPSPLAALLRDLASAFADLSLRWYLFGAQAAIVYGAARLTGDVDITIDIGTTALPSLQARLLQAGFSPRVADLDGFVSRTRVLPLIHLTSNMPVDVVLAGKGLEELFLERAQVRDIDGVAVPIACAEDILAMKILAGRAKDAEDAVAILAANQDTLHLELVRETLKALEEALARSDLLPALEQALMRSRF